MNSSDNVTKYAVAYLRISDRKQIDGESPETQRRVIQEYADRSNIKILEWFYDEAKSGKNTERDELQKLLQFASKHAKKIDHVLVFKLNRASRDLESYITTVKAVLAGKGITIRSATEPIDDSPIGRWLESMIILNGQLDNEIKGSATTENMKSLALQGWWQHGSILGYEKHTLLNDLGKERPTMKPDAMAPKVTQVLVRFSEGDINPMQLMRYAKDLGLKTKGYTIRKGEKAGTRVPPKPLGKSGIYALLRRPEYAGYVHDKFTDGKLVEGKHEALISPELYEHNQKLLRRKQVKKSGYTKHNEAYPLKDTLLCVGCHKPMYASAPLSGGGKSHSPRYHCYRASCKGVKVRSISLLEAHDVYDELLSRIQPSEGFLRGYKEILIRQAARENNRLNDQVRAKRHELDDLANKRLAALQDSVGASDKRKHELGEVVDSYDLQKITLNNELDNLLDMQTVQEAKIEYAIRHMHDLAKQWRDADYHLRQRFQSMVFPEGVTLNIKTMQFGTEQISPLYRYINTKEDLPELEKSSLVISSGIEPELPG